MYFERLKRVVYSHRRFFIHYGILSLVGLYPLLAYDKVTLFRKLNALHHPLLDYLFYGMTNLGSSISYGLLMVGLWLARVPYRQLGVGFGAFAGVSLIVQTLKRLVFPDQQRPLARLAEVGQLHMVEHVKPLYELSFPSGHAATIFAAACFIQLIMPQKVRGYSLVGLLIATLVAYSRVYLAQHFYTDIYVGALIGVWVTTAIYAGVTRVDREH